MGTDERVYRGSIRILVAVTVTAATGALGLLLAVATTTWLSPLERSVLSLVVIGPIGWLLIRAWRSTTIVTADGLTARGLISTRRVAWPDVQEVRVEINPGGFAASEAPDEIVVAYLGSGRTLILPHVNQRSLDACHRDLRREVAGIRDTWIRNRGARWTGIEEVQRQVAERARYGMSSWMVGCIPASFVMVLLIVIFLIGFPTGLHERLGPPLSWLFDPLAALVVPSAAYIIGSLVSLMLRRRGARRARS